MTMPRLLAEFWVPSAADLHWFTPELAVLCTIVAVLLAAIAVGRNPHITAMLVLLGAGCAILFAQVADSRMTDGVAGPAPARAAPMLIADSFSAFFKTFLLVLLAAVTGLWLIGLRQRPPQTARLFAGNAPEFFTLLLGSALGMMLMVGTLNLLMIVLAIELASMPSYAIVGFNKGDRLGAEASLKYVVFGAITAACMLYGVSMLYGLYGTLDMPTIAQLAVRRAGESAGTAVLTSVGLVTFGAGIGFKIAAVPFHFWCPDVFEGAPVEITTWLSIASKAAGLGLALRVAGALTSAPSAGQVESLWGPMAIAVGAAAAVTCTVGNFAAYRPDNVKRILAYSSIAHAGYMLMAAAILPLTGPHGEATPSSSTFSALVAYLVMYLFMNVGAFGVTAIVSWQTGSASISAFDGLGRRAPWLAVPMAVCLFSLVGLPPLGGFIAKWWLLYALGRGAAAQSWLWALVIVLVLNTLFSLYYYLRIVRVMFVKTGPHEAERPPLAAPLGGLVLVNACAVMLLIGGTIGIGPFKSFADDAASRIFDSVAGPSVAVRH